MHGLPREVQPAGDLGLAGAAILIPIAIAEGHFGETGLGRGEAFRKGPVSNRAKLFSMLLYGY